MAAAPPQSALTAWRELSQLARLATPIIVVQVGMNAMGFVDVAMLGHWRGEGLAAMSLGHVLSWAVLVFGMGMIAALDPLLSQAVGAGDGPAQTRVLLRGAYLAVLIALPSAVAMLPAEHWLAWLGQRSALIPDAAAYARICAWSFLPFLWFQVLRSFTAAHARLRGQVLVIIVANLLNAGLDWVLVFGHLGFPELGVAGAAWATVACRWLMFALLLALEWRHLRGHLAALGDAAIRARVFAWAPLRRLVAIGFPIAVQFSLEMGVFAATALLIGWFGESQLAGHQVALQFAALSFMVPLGLSMAASVRVGWAVGRGDTHGVRRTVHVSLAAGGGVMAVFMVVFLLAPDALAHLLTDVPEVVTWAALLLPVAGVFQVGDGLQVVAIGCLRGLGETRAPAVVNVIGFWLLGLPVGALLGFGLDLGPPGLWWGLCVGLFAVAVALLWLLRRGLPRERTRLREE